MRNRIIFIFLLFAFIQPIQITHGAEFKISPKPKLQILTDNKCDVEVVSVIPQSCCSIGTENLKPHNLFLLRKLKVTIRNNPRIIRPGSNSPSATVSGDVFIKTVNPFDSTQMNTHFKSFNNLKSGETIVLQHIYNGAVIRKSSGLKVEIRLKPGSSKDRDLKNNIMAIQL